MENFLNEFTELFDEKPAIKLEENTVFKELPGWDSLVALSLIVSISNSYGKSIDGEIIRNCVTLRDLFEVINA